MKPGALIILILLTLISIASAATLIMSPEPKPVKSVNRLAPNIEFKWGEGS